MNGIEFEKPLRESKAYKMICQDIKQGLGHAYMVVSPDEDALESFFKLTAATIFCESKTGCLECIECNKVLHDNHPDVFFMNKEQKKIGVEDAKTMLEPMSIKSLTNRKVFFIYRADLMNPASQNKFLKTLEEPPQNVTIFLGVCNESSMLNTIASRTRTISIDLFDEDVIYNSLINQGIDESTAAIASSCSEGLLGKAKKIAKSEDYTLLYQNAIHLLKELNRSSDVMSLDSTIAYQSNLDAFLDVLSIILTDMLHEKSKTKINSKHILHDIESLSSKYSERAIAEIIFRINEERKKLSLSLSSLGIIEDLLFFMLEAKHKWQ